MLYLSQLLILWTIYLSPSFVQNSSVNLGNAIVILLKKPNTLSSVDPKSSRISFVKIVLPVQTSKKLSICLLFTIAWYTPQLALTLTWNHLIFLF